MSDTGPNPVENPVATQPGRFGGTLKRGGTNPGAGRPPDEFKKLMRDAVSRDETIARILQVIDDPEHPAWMKAVAFAAERGYGKVAQPIVGEDGGKIQADITLRLVKATKADGDG